MHSILVTQRLSLVALAYFLLLKVSHAIASKSINDVPAGITLPVMLYFCYTESLPFCAAFSPAFGHQEIRSTWGPKAKLGGDGSGQHLRWFRIRDRTNKQLSHKVPMTKSCQTTWFWPRQNQMLLCNLFVTPGGNTKLVQPRAWMSYLLPKKGDISAK